MKSKINIEFGFDNEFTIIGIACHVKDYRFCWMLNQHLDINLRRVKDFSPEEKEATENECFFSFYYCKEFCRDESFFLLANHSSGRILYDRFSQIDYLFFISDLAFPGGVKALKQEIKKIPQVLTAFEIEPDDKKELFNIISAMEITMIEHKKEIKENNNLNQDIYK